MITFAICIWLFIATFCACVARVITNSWRHTGVALLWPFLALFGALALVGKALALVGDAGSPFVARVGNRLTAGWPLFPARTRVRTEDYEGGRGI